MIMNCPTITELQGEGLRERKRRETRQRIIDCGLERFLAEGYAGTTVDQIAEAAGICRRSFFHYFKSKDDLILAWLDGAWGAICDQVAISAAAVSPLDAVCAALVQDVSRYETTRMIAIDRLMRASENLVACKQASHARQEEALFEALCRAWPDPARRAGLRMVAMASTGAMRLAVDAWHRDDCRRPLAEHVAAAFADLKQAV